MMELSHGNAYTPIPSNFIKIKCYLIASQLSTKLYSPDFLKGMVVPLSHLMYIGVDLRYEQNKMT